MTIETMKDAHEFLIGKFKSYAKNLNNSNWSVIEYRLKNWTIASGSDGGRYLIVNISGFVFRVDDGAHNIYSVLHLNGEVNKQVAKKLVTRLTKAKQLNNEIDELEEALNYPYKKGAMECVNKRLDIWEPTKRHLNKINSRVKKASKLDVEIIDLINAEFVNRAEFERLCGQVGVHPELVVEFSEIEHWQK